MKHLFGAAVVLIATLAVSCNPQTPGTAQGGTTATGGVTAMGGDSGTGGMTTAMGGSMAMGGMSSTGGTVTMVDPLAQDLVAITEPVKVIEATFTELTRHKPTFAVFGTDGDRSHDAEMDDVSAAEWKKFYVRMRYLGTKLETIDISKLTPSQQLGHDVAISAVKDSNSREVAGYEQWEMSILYDQGDDLPYYSAVGPIRNRADFDNLVSRYNKVPKFYDDQIANYTQGIAKNRVAPQTIVQNVIDKNEALFSLPSSDMNNAFMANLTFDMGVSDADKTAWTAEFAKVVDEKINPAGMKWVNFLKTSMLPKARTTTFGIGAIDVGAALYAGQVAYHTGDTRSAAELFTLGQQRVAEIETQMKTELSSLGITDSVLSAALTKSNALPDSKPATVDQIKAHVETDIVTKLSSASWATDVWGVVNPPAVNIQYRDATGNAFYQPGVQRIRIFTQGSSLVSLDSTIVHEYTHYLQELATTAQAPFSPVQAFFGSTAMTEGGALYSEVYALENGFYTWGTPTQKTLVRLNALSNLMLRAVRLVVDTGIHTQNWTRQQAIDYMRARLTDTDASIAYQADRYASYPAQALAYRVGLEAILKAQTKAKAALGMNFNQRNFNKMVLSASGGGASLLDKKTDLFIANNGTF